LKQQIHDLTDLAKLGDESLRAELEAEIAKLEADLEKRSFAMMLSGPYDHDDAILAIHAGAGGTDSQDWADMLQRMYLRWAEDHNFTMEILDTTPGEEAGIKSVTIAVGGRHAFGYLRSEKGVHRLVRLPRLMRRIAGIPPLHWWRCCLRFRWRRRISTSTPAI
jgi:peptide chain release factor 2